MPRNRNRHSSQIPTVYTDGACSNNGYSDAIAGWGCWWGDDHPNNAWGSVDGPQTNNRAELTAVVEALDQAIADGYHAIRIITDSELIVKSIYEYMPIWKRNGWRNLRRHPVANRDLLKQIDEQMEEINVTFKHVRGHSGIRGNEEADEMARFAIQEQM